MTDAAHEDLCVVLHASGVKSSKYLAVPWLRQSFIGFLL